MLGCDVYKKLFETKNKEIYIRDNKYLLPGTHIFICTNFKQFKEIIILNK